MTEKPICTRCGAEHKDTEHQLCDACREYWRTKDAERRSGKVCVDCRERKRAKGKTRCKICAEKRRFDAATIRETRKSHGLCVTCGAAAVPGKTMCEKHLAYYAQRK